MDIKYKIKLIEILRLSPADLDVLDSVILSDSCLEAIMKGDRAALDKELGAIVENKNADERTRLVAASLKSLLLWNTASDELDKEYEAMMLEILNLTISLWKKHGSLNCTRRIRVI